jgi:hypothetical protein
MRASSNAESAFPDVFAAIVGAMSAVVIYAVKAVESGSFSFASMSIHALIGVASFVIIARVRSRFGQGAVDAG